MLVLLLALLALPAEGQFAGSESCRKCHPAQFDGHARTGHARALSKPLPTFPKADWAFGAGLQAITFVSRVNEEYYLEHGLSWYASSKSLALTPGHRNAEGERYRIFDPPAAMLRCFQCHSTGALRMGEGFSIEPAEPGVQCETCHGPGGAHPVSQKPIGNPKHSTADEVNGLCGACHRMPAPGAGATDWSNPWNTRHQPLYLAESACFRKSGGKLSCFSCHAPHAELNHDAAFYEGVCKSCHARPKHLASVTGRSCWSCHMPLVRPQNNLKFANHWIGVYTAGSPLRPRRPK